MKQRFYVLTKHTIFNINKASLCSRFAFLPFRVDDVFLHVTAQSHLFSNQAYCWCNAALDISVALTGQVTNGVSMEYQTLDF